MESDETKLVVDVARLDPEGEELVGEVLCVDLDEPFVKGALPTDGAGRRNGTSRARTFGAGLRPRLLPLREGLRRYNQS